MDCWCRRGRLVIGGGGCDVTVAVLLRGSCLVHFDVL